MKAKRIGRDEVIEKFGVPPEKVIDVQSLAGDSVDNVPGVPGIGVKTAAELINEYGDLDTLLARAGEIKQPKRREKLIEFADQARISRATRDAEGRRAGEGRDRYSRRPRAGREHAADVSADDGIQFTDQAHRRRAGRRRAAAAGRIGRRSPLATAAAVSGSEGLGRLIEQVLRKAPARRTQAPRMPRNISQKSPSIARNMKPIATAAALKNGCTPRMMRATSRSIPRRQASTATAPISSDFRSQPQPGQACYVPLAHTDGATICSAVAARLPDRCRCATPSR